MGWRFTAIAIAPLIPVGTLLLACVQPPSANAVPVPGEVTLRIGMDPHGLLSRLEPVPEDPLSRSDRLRDLFAEAGCSELIQQKAGRSRAPNVVCTLRGESADTIVVGANFEAPTDKRIRSDDWSAAAMLPSLFESIRVDPRHHTFRFVALSNRRHKGRHHTGFRTFFETLGRQERRQIRAVVAIKGSKLDPTRARDGDSDQNLSLDLYSVSRSLELPVGHARKGPLPYFLSWRGRTPSLEILVGDLEVGEYLDSYRLLAVYLGYLDHTLDVRRRTFGTDAHSRRSS